MSKNYYTYAQILFGLREAYLENQKKLDELKSYIHVLDNNSFELYSYIDEFDFKRPEKKSFDRANRICFNIIKKQCQLVKIIEYINYRLGKMANDSSIYIINKYDDGFCIDDYAIGRKYHPELLITDEKKFNELAKDIINSKFYSLPPVYEELNPFQIISISTFDTYLVFAFGNYWTDFSYKSSNDTVVYSCSGHLKHLGYNELPNALLETKIPKSIVPKCYREIIDATIDKCKNVEIACKLGNGITELSINNDENSIILKKKRKLHVYDD